MHFAHVASTVIFAFAMSACSSSSSNSAPVVTSFTAPDSVAATTVNGQAAYVLSGDLNFEDSTENVVSFTAHADPPNSSVTIQDSTVSIPPAQQAKQGPLQIQLALPADPAGKSGYGPGKVNYTISVTGASGTISAPLAKTVTLQ